MRECCGNVDAKADLLGARCGCDPASDYECGADGCERQWPPMLGVEWHKGQANFLGGVEGEVT